MLHFLKPIFLLYTLHIEQIYYLTDNEQFDILNDDARAVEKIITGIRTVRGVKLSADVVKQIDFDYVKNHPDLINQNDEYLSATSKLKCKYI